MSDGRFITGKYVILILILLVISVVSISIVSIFFLRNREIDSWKRQLSNLSLVLADQTDQSMSSAEIALDSIVGHVNTFGVRNGADLFSKVHTKEFYALMRDTIAGLPQIDVASIISADGTLINFTRSFPAPEINLSDRDYFQAQSKTQKVGIFYSAPVQNRGNGKWVYYLSRRLSDKSGNFLGLALVGISIDFFNEFYEHLCDNLGEDASITLFRDDFTYMTRWPKKDELLGTKNVAGTSRLVVEVMKKTNDVIYNDGPRQSNSNRPTARLGAVRVLERLPFIVNLTVTEEVFLANWYGTARYISAISAGSIIALLIGGGMLLRAIRQKEKSINDHESELIRVAHFDLLTSIPNRILLADRMKQAIYQTSRDKSMMAVCYLDLDCFKPINDNFGHHAGDEVLIEIAKRIGSTVRGGDTVARLGGDEFVILLLGLDKGEECVATLERILAAVAEPISFINTNVSVTASIGVSIFPLDNEDADTLLRHADHAMYVAKQSGKSRFKIYDVDLDIKAKKQSEFQKSISIALEKNQFELHYQPKVNLRTKRMVGAEALIRWRHPERGLLSPAEFLRYIENTDLDIQIGEWVIATALAQMNYWQSAGADIKVSINISGYHLESAAFMSQIQKQFANYPNLQFGNLLIEVLETVALSDIKVVQEIIESCRRIGVGFALDDFGTGYSSLSYLSALPVDTLKIDQSFVRDMLEDKGDMAIVHGIIALAKAFERNTVAEGIETDEQYEALLDMGCEIGQGYGIARPMSAEDLAGWQVRFC